MVRIAAADADITDLLDPRAELRLLADGFVFTEGPVWDAATGSLLFNDIRNDAGWRWHEATGATLVARPNFIGNGMVFEPTGDLLVCEHVTSTVVRVRRNQDRRIVAYHYQGRYLNSPNDVVTRSDGTIYFTDPDYGRWDHAVGVHRRRELDFQGLFSVTPAGQVYLAAPADTFDQPNGLCLSPDESELYVDDRRGIKAFPVNPDGTLGPARQLRTDLSSPQGQENGDPDGMKCDADGNIWCTGRGGVWIMKPSGELRGVLETPEIVANLAWGGPDWRTLFLCTSTTVHALRTRIPSARLPYH